MHVWLSLLTDGLVTLFLGAIGGNLGSFLNVVVHRLPRGESVVGGGSRCPACGAPIRWHDNLPVVGWLVLRGRCRDCAAEIAPRYPWLEACGAVFLGGTAAVELLSGGATLPGSSPVSWRSGADNLLVDPDPRLVGIVLLHAWILFNLLLAAAVDTDGHGVPRRYAVWAVALTAVAVTACDRLAPLAAWDGDIVPLPTARSGPLRGASIALAGVSCGAILGSARGGPFGFGMALLGAGLGWQAAVGTFLLVPASGLARRIAASALSRRPCAAEPSAGASPAEATGWWRVLGGPPRRVLESAPPSVDLLVAAAIHLLAWRWVADLWP